MNNVEPISPSKPIISWGWTTPENLNSSSIATSHRKPSRFAVLFAPIDLLKPLRMWLDSIQFSNPQIAHRVCQLVPAQCPFERDVTVFGRVIVHIPPMCKLNPLYEEVVGLRFRALCYLADECGEDISRYC